MKSILLYIAADDGVESRIEAALAAARAHAAHLNCIQVTPFEMVMIGDPFGTTSLLPTISQHIRDRDDEQRQRLEERLGRAGVSSDWRQLDGLPDQRMVEQSRLADLIVLNLPGESGALADPPATLTGSVALHARTPVLAVPMSGAAIDAGGPALVAWNGSQECAHALRLALPMIRSASAVHIVTVGDERTEFPAARAAEYLARYDVASEVHAWPAGEASIAEALLQAAASLNVSYIVMGAYGRSRFMETILGGVTLDLLRAATPLVLAH